MKIKLDENVSASLATVFENHGASVDTVVSEGLQGCSDDVVFEKTQSENRLLVTCDLDFADIRRFPPSKSNGIVVLRLSNRSSRSVISRISSLLESISLHELDASITIVSDNRVRRRR